MKVLLICPKFFEYEKKIQELIKKEIGYEVFYLNLAEYKHEYINIFERIYNNLFYKPILKKNLRDQKWMGNVIKKIEKIKREIDIVLYIRPDGVHEKLIKYLKGLNVRLIGHQWDTMNSLHGIEKYIKYFNKFSTFDLEEAKKYKIGFIPNFYLKERKDLNIEEKLDIFTIISYDERVESLEKIARDLKRRNKKYLFLVYSKNKKIKSEYLKIVYSPISLEKIYELIQLSDIVLEIGHTRNIKQGGLSFRAIDCIGMKKN